MKNKNGFTLIELLAVIIILGILMIIAIPSVTRYISDSRKNAYVDTAKEIISGARNFVNEGKLSMYDTDTAYYIPSSCIKTENARKSPYGDFVLAYVVVTYDGKGYDYYWTSVDDAGQGIKDIVSIDDLDTDDIESDLTADDIKEGYTVNGRTMAGILDESTCSIYTGYSAKSNINYNGKSREELALGDLVTIGDEEFYVMKIESDKITLLSHYNLNVGDYKVPNAKEGVQNSEAKGWYTGSTAGSRYGGVKFFLTYAAYWRLKVGDGLTYPGQYCTEEGQNNCAYVFDNNSNIYQYTSAYKTYLESQGAIIKKVRLLSLEEAMDIKRTSLKLSQIMYVSSFWLGNPKDVNVVWAVFSNLNSHPSGYDGASYDDHYGVRPVIEI